MHDFGIEKLKLKNKTCEVNSPVKGLSFYRDILL